MAIGYNAGCPISMYVPTHARALLFVGLIKSNHRSTRMDRPGSRGRTLLILGLVVVIVRILHLLHLPPQLRVRRFVDLRTANGRPGPAPGEADIGGRTADGSFGDKRWVLDPMGERGNSSGSTPTLIVSILSSASGKMQKKIEKDTRRVSVFHNTKKNPKAVALLYHDLDQSKTSPHTLKTVEGKHAGVRGRQRRGGNVRGRGMLTSSLTCVLLLTEGFPRHQMIEVGKIRRGPMNGVPFL